MEYRNTAHLRADKKQKREGGKDRGREGGRKRGKRERDCG